MFTAFLKTNPVKMMFMTSCLNVVVMKKCVKKLKRSIVANMARN